MLSEVERDLPVHNCRVATLAVIILVRIDIRQIEQALAAPDVAVVRTAHAHRTRVEVDVSVQIQQRVTKHKIHSQTIGERR